GARIVKASGFVDETESPEKLIDGRGETKWCDSQNAPQWIDIELGKEENVTRWVLLNAGAEQNDYITRSCLLMGKKNLSDDWTILDQLEGNRKNKTNRTFTPQKLRYLRLIVTAPEQSEGARGAARLYELELYGK
ncbi:MAG: discoidin domain-containing protein, partial [Prevotellaceae bacterium]|nr:discoidin domain-containing protein [Prevotellaceae bacterium]